jgi:plastocyanin
MSQTPQTTSTNQFPLAIFVIGIVVIGVAVLLGILLSSTGSDGSDEEPVIVNDQTVIVEIEDFAFHPSNISILQSATVLWENVDNTAHDARDDDKEWETPLIQKDGSASLNFNEPGTYTYHCSIHPYMKGTITVREVAGTPATTQTPSPTVAQ